MTPEIKTAELLLAEITKNQESLEYVKRELDEKIKPYIDRYSEIIAEIAAKIAADETALEKHVIKYQAAIMAGEDRVDLATGSLLLKIEKRVKRVKKMLENLKAAGFVDAIKTVESVNWDELEKWDTEKLGLVGAEKKDKLIFGYEIKQSKGRDGKEI